MSEANQELPGGEGERACWCGHGVLAEYSSEYRVCKACGTLVSRAPVARRSVAGPDAGRGDAREAISDLYSSDYWLRRQREHHKLPDIFERARLDLPERCIHWLRDLLRVQLPPGRILELGCGHGGYVALLNWAGFEAVGTEMSAWVADFAQKTFGVRVFTGPVETQTFGEGGFDVIVLNDVIEHLEKPAETLAHCARLLSPTGFFVIQTPEYKEHLSHAELVATGDLFLRHMENNNEEHLYLFSRRSVAEMFKRLGFGEVVFGNPVFSYDMTFTASRRPLPEFGGEAVWASLSKTPSGRMAQALLDKAFESNDRWWAIQRLKAEGGTTR